MLEFNSEWVLSSCTEDGLMALYIGYSKEWCLKCHYRWPLDVLYQNVEGTVEQGMLRFTGKVRYVFSSNICFGPYNNTSILDKIEIEPHQYEIKKTWIRKEDRIFIKDGKYLYKVAGDTLTTTTPVFRLVDARV